MEALAEATLLRAELVATGVSPKVDGIRSIKGRGVEEVERERAGEGWPWLLGGRGAWRAGEGEGDEWPLREGVREGSELELLLTWLNEDEGPALDEA
jgi:hypothetical protein